MYFNQFYLGCLAHASYMIGSDGEAAVIDPQRDVDIYLDEARQHGLSIKHVIETHLHADFVSGHRELSMSGREKQRALTGLDGGDHRDAAEAGSTPHWPLHYHALFSHSAAGCPGASDAPVGQRHQ